MENRTQTDLHSEQMEAAREEFGLLWLKLKVPLIRDWKFNPNQLAAAELMAWKSFLRGLRIEG